MESKYQLSRIHNYVNGLMSKEEMYALEREALNDPFLQEAIDGYALKEGVDAGQLSLLQKRLTARIASQASAKNKRFYSWQRLAIGMAAAVMFVAVCTLLLIRYLPQKNVSLTEVEIMQEPTYAITLTPSGLYDGAPQEGWQQLEKYLSENYTGQHVELREVTIQLTIDGSGKVVDITTKNKDQQETKELLDLLENGPTWNGTSATFHVTIRPLSVK